VADTIQSFRHVIPIQIASSSGQGERTTHNTVVYCCIGLVFAAEYLLNEPVLDPADNTDEGLVRLKYMHWFVTTRSLGCHGNSFEPTPGSSYPIIRESLSQGRKSLG